MALRCWPSPHRTPICSSDDGRKLTLSSGGAAANVRVDCDNYNVKVVWADATAADTLVLSNNLNADYDYDVNFNGTLDIEGYGDFGTLTANAITGTITGDNHGVLHATGAAGIHDLLIKGDDYGTLGSASTITNITIQGDLLAPMTASGDISVGSYFAPLAQSVLAPITSAGAVSLYAGNILSNVSAQTGLSTTITSGWGRINGTLTTASGDLAIVAPGDVVGAAGTGDGVLGVQSYYGCVAGNFNSQQ
jgi:hypothetical protein